MIKLKDILITLGRTIQTALPQVERMYLEQVEKARDLSQTISEKRYNILSLELVYYNTEVLDQNRINCQLGFDLVYLPKSSKNRIDQGLSLMNRLAQALAWGFYQGNRFIHSEEGPKYRYVDELLHMELSYSWIETFQPVVLVGGKKTSQEGHESHEGQKEQEDTLAEVDLDVTDPRNIRDDQDTKRKKEKNEEGIIQEDIAFMETLYFVVKD